MSKRKSTPYEVDDEFFAQIDFLRNDYNQAQETIDQQKADIRQLLALRDYEEKSVNNNLL